MAAAELAAGAPDCRRDSDRWNGLGRVPPAWVPWTDPAVTVGGQCPRAAAPKALPRVAGPKAVLRVVMRDRADDCRSAAGLKNLPLDSGVRARPKRAETQMTTAAAGRDTAAHYRLGRGLVFRCFAADAVLPLAAEFPLERPRGAERPVWGPVWAPVWVPGEAFPP